MSGARQRRPLDGLLLLDKSTGWTSNQALKKAQYLLNANKAGHCGTLDPMATGLLPVLLGEATKFSGALLGADKTYLATLRLGVRTDSGDADGQIIAEHEVTASRSDWDRVSATFMGEIDQVPPMFSALKRDGKPLYEYARAGIEVEREARRVRIEQLDTLDFTPPTVTIRVRCSKGTYIRTLAEDIGQALGCGAHLTSLRREQIDTLDVGDAIRIETLMELDPPARLARLLPLDLLLTDLPTRLLDEDQCRRFRLGQRLRISAPGAADAHRLTVRVYAGAVTSDRLLGIAHEQDGLLAPQRVLNTHSSSGDNS